MTSTPHFNKQKYWGFYSRNVMPTPLCSPLPAAHWESPGRGCLQIEPYPRRPSGVHSAGSGSGEERSSHSLERPESLLTSHPGVTQRKLRFSLALHRSFYSSICVSLCARLRKPAGIRGIVLIPPIETTLLGLPGYSTHPAAARPANKNEEQQ